MKKTEDPGKQLSYLQQCLSSNKKPLGLFLGAGCPMAVRTGVGRDVPLIPDIAGITRLVQGELASCEECGATLRAVERQFQEDGRSSMTVEDILTHVRALYAVAGKSQVRGLSAEKLDQLDARICQIIHQVVGKTLPDVETPYHGISSWANAIRRDCPVEVFTTNYDLLMEQAFEDLRVPYFDGFAGSRRPCFDLRAMEEDMLPPRWARLWKLHGSINWFHVPEKGVFRSIPQGEDGSSSKRVIHPSHLKYQESRRMPYLAMIDRLRAFLKKPTATLIVCGYSFRDEHINEVILQGLEYTQTAVAFALLFGPVSQSPQAVTLARTRFNLNILARDGAIISGQDCRWPEKDAESLAAGDGKWVTWRPVEPNHENGRRMAEFTLGDFAVFGQFLRELAGTGWQHPEGPYA